MRLVTVAWMTASLAALPGWPQTSIRSEGEVEAQGFKGDGSQLTNVTAVSAASAEFATEAANADKLDHLDASEFALDSQVEALAAALAALQLQVDALGTAQVPRTGQTTTFTGGDDGDRQLGVTWPNPRFTKNGDGTVTDNLTGLVWLEDASCAQLSQTDAEGLADWFQALSSASDLADGVCGLTDGSVPGQWRLPNLRELHSLATYDYSVPAIPDTVGTGQWVEGDPFSDVKSTNFYWSSTTAQASSSFAWTLDTSNGDLDFRQKSSGPPIEGSYVWPVRDGH
jgi:hypothetical protein